MKRQKSHSQLLQNTFHSNSEFFNSLTCSIPILHITSQLSSVSLSFLPSFLLHYKISLINYIYTSTIYSPPFIRVQPTTPHHYLSDPAQVLDLRPLMQNHPCILFRLDKSNRSVTRISNISIDHSNSHFEYNSPCYLNIIVTMECRLQELLFILLHIHYFTYSWEISLQKLQH